MKRQRIVAGNWKMNKTFGEGRELAFSIVRQLGPAEALAVLCPPYIHLSYLASVTKGIANVRLGAQNCYSEKSGAYTGEVSAAMLHSIGVEYVITGHSERREYFAETNEMLARKVDVVLEQGMRPIFCCGEKLDIREAATHLEYVGQQIKDSLFHLTKEQFSKVVLAYEPIWAIGTGKTASPRQAQEMHAHIRSIVAAHFGNDLANLTTILYGGSCKPSNSKELFSQPDVDGGLIGGASLVAQDFVSIVNSF
jgi:triosephosphate isomerase (TIM)